MATEILNNISILSQKRQEQVSKNFLFEIIGKIEAYVF